MKEKIKNWIDNNHITLHVYAGMLVVMITGLLAHIWVDSFKAGCIGIGAGIFAGIFKEIVIDKWLKLGHPHLADFLWTCWGVLWGAIMITVVFNIHNWTN